MKGLCHRCLKSNVDIDILRGKSICKQCRKTMQKTK